jgi:hypothetical protein
MGKKRAKMMGLCRRVWESGDEEERRKMWKWCMRWNYDAALVREIIVPSDELTLLNA